MDTTFLESAREEILAEAWDGAAASSRYATAGGGEVGRRLEVLFDALVDAGRTNDVHAIVEYARTVARVRFAAGYGLGDVQVAVNALEEATWKCVLAQVPPEEAAEALRVVSTVLGLAKDALAQEYVRLACEARAPAVDVAALAGGAAAG
ncbi:MAG TPA: hypothetical protein VFL60_11085 [Gaiellaceae bacterium]|nr:hypothetical protein [Gaiellaceae bacterium]